MQLGELRELVGDGGRRERLEANTKHGIFADGGSNNTTNRWDNYLVTS